MPKSKRAKVVNLTKVKKKTREWKSALLEKVRTLCDKHESVYVIKYYNMRNDRFKELREDLRESSSIMLASTKKLQAALGREEETECRPLVHKLCPFLFGCTGLLFTDLPESEVSSIFDDFLHEDYARAGGRATRTVKLPEGPLVGPGGTPFAHTMEHTLRANGLPTKLNKGVIELRCEHTVCTEGRALSTQQAAVLRHFDIKMATFRLKLKAVVHGKVEDTAQFKVLDEEESEDEAPELEAMDGDVSMFDDGLPPSMMMPAAVAQS